MVLRAPTVKPLEPNDALLVGSTPLPAPTATPYVDVSYAYPSPTANYSAQQPTQADILPSFRGIGTTPESNYVTGSPLARDSVTGTVGNINPSTGAVNQPGTEGATPSTLQVNPNPQVLVQPKTMDPYFGLGAPPPVFDESQIEADPEYAAIKRRLDQNYQRQFGQVDEDTAAVRQDVGNRRNLMQQQHPQDLKNLLESFAGRGMAFSGRYATDQGNVENEYAGALSGLDTEQANRVTAIQRALTNLQADNNNQLEDARVGVIRRKAAQQDTYNAALLAAKARANGAA